MKKKEIKEPIVTGGAIRLKLNYFTDGLSVAIFNTREPLIWNAKLWVIGRGKGISPDELNELNEVIDAGIMSMFKRTPTRVLRLFAFRFARLTDDYFASGGAEREQEREDLFNRTTADGLDSKNLKTLWYIDGVNLKLIEVNKHELKIHRAGGAERKDGLDLTPLASSMRMREMFGSLSAAQVEFEKYLLNRIILIEKNIEDRKKELTETRVKLQQLKQDTAVYLKQSSTGKKPETIGKIRI